MPEFPNHAQLIEYSHKTFKKIFGYEFGMCTGMFLAGSIYQAMRKVLFQISGTGLHGQVNLTHAPPPP